MSRLFRLAGVLFAGGLLLCAELALRTFPLESLLRGVARARRLAGLDGRRRGVAPRAASWLAPRVRDADGLLPGLESSCLRRALVLRLLSCETARLRIGVRRSPGGRLRAHAWLEPGQGEAEGFQEIAAL